MDALVAEKMIEEYNSLVWDTFREELIKSYDSPEFKRPSDVASSVLADRMIKAIKESFANGSNSDWVKHNPTTGKVAKRVFGIKTTKEWREKVTK